MACHWQETDEKLLQLTESKVIDIEWDFVVFMQETAQCKIGSVGLIYDKKKRKEQYW